MNAKIIQKELNALGSAEKAKSSAWFFKTGKGQYGYGDKFIGITLPEQRSVAKKYFKEIELSELDKLLNSEIHEYRMTALLILTYKFPKSNKTEQKSIYEFYLKNLRNINNWDLVDASAAQIVGEYLLAKDRSILYKLAKSNDLWENRVAMIATYQFINQKQYEDTFKIAEILLHHKHDLIHKAVGWMLREVGKRIDEKHLLKFLDKYSTEMPRTMLRYAIERLEENMRLEYLGKKVRG